MKNITRFLLVFAIVFLATTSIFAQTVSGDFKMRYVGTSATAPTSIVFNTTFDRTTTYVQDPGYPIHLPWETSFNRVGTLNKNQTAIVVGQAGGSAFGYTAWCSYILKDLKFRKGGTTYYTLTPAEITNMEYVGDIITVMTPWDSYQLELSWDGDDTLLTITHL